ncbi:histone deacetylase family protein [Chitinivorax sp. B]|uniref:histone deacetylase family protein n=1 Tax=Chitinivorax sp. B TaxID=2502235 RepID=UPI002017F805|nr:histone deacetylase family protein [Chitinivorax sp. B]
MLTAFVTHPDCLLHDMGSYHPECPQRIQAIEDQLIANGLMDFLSYVEAPVVTHEQLSRVHTQRYIEQVETSSPMQGIVHLDPDTAMNCHTLKAARRAAGAVVKAVDVVMSGEAPNAFCCVRPPGHHAESRRAMGFCFFNNIAVGAAHAMMHYGLERVAIVDFDVHHGNGTEEIFHDNPRVLMVSTFQHPFYPYSGDRPMGGNMVNVPLPAGTRGDTWREAVGHHWLPALRDFRPDLIMISAGFDAHMEDDMASFGLMEADYAWVTNELKALADECAEGRIVSVLEGGYALSALGRSVVAHLRALSGLS